MRSLPIGLRLGLLCTALCAASACADVSAGPDLDLAREELAAYQGPISSFPPTSTVILSDGTPLDVPSYFHSRATIVFGTASVSSLKALQGSVTSYKPVSIGGTGIVAVWLNEQLPDGDLGGYGELVVSHLVQPAGAAAISSTFKWTPERGQTFVDQLAKLLGQTIFFYDALWVDSQLGLIGGLEVWGFPKRMGTITDSTTFLTNYRRFKVADGATKASVIDASVHLPYLHLFSLPNLTVASVTKGSAPYPASAEAMAFRSGPVGLRPFNPLLDRMRLNQVPQLAGLNFTPLVVMDAPDFEFLVGEPQPL